MKEGTEATPLVPKDGALKRLAVLASCVGFLADSYDLFTIDLVVLILELHYGEALISAKSKALMVSTMLFGVVAGQLLFGLLADRWGRRWTFISTAGLTVFSCLASALCGDAAVPLPLQLALCRFVLGCGVGGEYPLSATVSAEAVADGNSRGQVMTLVVSMQGFGMLLASVLALLLVHMGISLEALWRLLLAFGAIPSALAFCLRWQLTESEAFQESQRSQVRLDQSHGQKVLETLGSYWHLLLGTSSAWLLMNMFMYSLASFKSSIFEAVIHSTAATDQVWDQAFFASLTSAFAIAGFAAGFLLIRSVSRFDMQFYGFLALSAVFFGVSLFTQLQPNPSASSLLMMMGLVFFLVNSGPNLTTYILPAECFPTCCRASCHGVSAACGKLGACVGTAAFPLLQRSCGMPAVYLACGAASALGTLVTYGLTPRCMAPDIQKLESQP